MKNVFKNMESKIREKYIISKVRKYDKKAINDVYNFCKKAMILRTPENCSNYYKDKYSIKECERIIFYLFKTRKMGAYYFEKNVPPQKYMQKWILKHSNLNSKSKILEVGPGEYPIFEEKDYLNWYGIDLNYEDGVIRFANHEWGKNHYKKIFNGSWENLSDISKKYNLGNNFDLICGSHSFEHNYKPISALKQAGELMKTGGKLVLFVPDGYSTWQGNFDKSHAIYMVPDMVNEFFSYTDCFEKVTCTQFRVNMDLVITATKI